MSKVIFGVFLAGLGSLIGSYLSEACTNEILTKLIPFIGTLPGLLTAWIARVRMGGVNVAGFRKDASSS